MALRNPFGACEHVILYHNVAGGSMTVPWQRFISMYGRLLRILALCAFFLSSAPALAQQLNVVATIAPLDSIASNIMGGIGRPALLIPATATPQTFRVTPQVKAMMGTAQVVIWIGPTLEKTLAPLMATLPKTTRIVTVSRLPGIKLLPDRPAGIWSEDGASAPKGKSAINPNLWLDPENAAVIARAIQHALSTLDPNDAAVYQANADTFSAQLQALEYELKATLDPVRKVPFLVFRDSYAYLDQAYRLNDVGALGIAPGQTFAPSRLKTFRTAIRTLHVRCIFSEPQDRPTTAAALARGLPVHIAVLDPYGEGIGTGPDHYLTMMNRLANGIAECLSSQ